jgi:hypothetical protein
VLWLAGQVFLLCLVSFLAGAAVTAVALRRKPAPDNAEAVQVADDPADVEDTAAEEPEVEQATRPVIVKASKKSMRYHTPDSPYYNRVKDELTFPSVEEAELAGYTSWNKSPVRN